VLTGRRGNVETGAEDDKDNRGQPLCEYIGILKGYRNMKDPNGAKSHVLSNKMKTNLHLLGLLVMNGIS